MVDIISNEIILDENLKKEIESILYSDMPFIVTHIDGLEFWNKTDELFDSIKQKYSISDAFILNIIYNIICNNEIDFFIYINNYSFNGLKMDEPDRFFKLNAKINYKLMRPINWSNISLRKISREEAEIKFKDLVLSHDARLIDGNWQPITENEYSQIKLFCEIEFDKNLIKLLELADFYIQDKPVYNNILLNYIIESKDKSIIDKLICESETKEKLKKAKYEEYIKVYYDKFYEFLEDDKYPSFADKNPYYALYESLFESLKQAIEERNVLSLYKIQHRLKNCAEQFGEALRDSHWRVSRESELPYKYDKIVNFAVWIHNLGDYFKSQYYLIPDLKKKLFEYLVIIERRLFYPTIILLTSNLHTEKYSIYEGYLRYSKNADFDFECITEAIDSDYSAHKTIKEIIQRRNPSLKYTEGTIIDAFEQKVYNEILSINTEIEVKSSILLEHSTETDLKVQIDFITSDKKNSLTLIECKTQTINTAHKECYKKLKRLAEADFLSLTTIGCNENIIYETIRSSKLDDSILSQNNLKKFYFMKHFLDDIEMIFLVPEYHPDGNETDLIKKIAKSMNIIYTDFNDYKAE